MDINKLGSAVTLSIQIDHISSDIKTVNDLKQQVRSGSMCPEYVLSHLRSSQNQNIPIPKEEVVILLDGILKILNGQRDDIIKKVEKL